MNPGFGGDLQMLDTVFFAFFTSFDGAAWLAAVRDPAAGLLNWVGTNYAKAPALVLGLGVALAIPAIATTGALLRALLRPSRRRPPTVIASGEQHTRPASAWRQRAWLERADNVGARYRIAKGIMRIGRETDNDLCLMEPTVHRYHAILERTPEAEYYITYIGDPDLDGLRIDGRAARRQRLRGGEILEIGAIKLRFAMGAA